MNDWTLEQAAELLFEQILELLDGADDGDVVRPSLVLEAVELAWVPGREPVDWPELTAGELRRIAQAARAALAAGERIP